MKQLQIFLKREHFPSFLSDDDVCDAYLSRPCIMEKAIKSRFPDFKHHVSTMGAITEGARSGPIVGRIDGWDIQKANKIAGELEKDPGKQFLFTLLMDSDDYIPSNYQENALSLIP